MKLEFDTPIAKLPLKKYVYETEGEMSAAVEVQQHDTTDNTVLIDIDDMWFGADDLRSAAALFIELAAHLEVR